MLSWAVLYFASCIARSSHSCMHFPPDVYLSRDVCRIGPYWTEYTVFPRFQALPSLFLSLAFVFIHATFSSNEGPSARWYLDNLQNLLERRESSLQKRTLMPPRPPGSSRADSRDRRKDTTDAIHNPPPSLPHKISSVPALPLAREPQNVRIDNGG